MAVGPKKPDQWLTTTEAARRLGVKPETLYAYVSRGMLTSHRARSGSRRGSLFEPGEVARLAARSRSGGRARGLEVVIDSELTSIDPAGRLSFRGWDAEDACRRATFEEMAEWLWLATPAAGDPAAGASAPTAGASASPLRFSAPKVQLDLARAAADVLPSSAPPIERVRLAVAAAGEADPLRFDRRPEGVAASGRRILACVVAALGERAVPSPGIATSLWSSLGASRDGRNRDESASAGGIATLDAALVLLSDHELASSTLAARVAASTWADPYLVVLAGLAVLGGPLHGGVGDRVASLVRAAVEEGAARTVGEQMRGEETVVGFGHLVYESRDPRGDALLAAVRATWPEHPAVRAGDEMIRLVAAGGGTFPNVDFALGVMLAAGGFVEGSAEAIFATARIAGWLAHAVEEYGHRLRFRARAAYTGPPPGSTR
jgi:citrate synthase